MRQQVQIVEMLKRNQKLRNVHESYPKKCSQAVCTNILYFLSKDDMNRVNKIFLSRYGFYFNDSNLDKFSVLKLWNKRAILLKQNDELCVGKSTLIKAF